MHSVDGSAATPRYIFEHLSVSDVFQELSLTRTPWVNFTVAIEGVDKMQVYILLVQEESK